MPIPPEKKEAYSTLHKILISDEYGIDHKKQTPLMIAFENNLNIIDDLIKKPFTINQQDGDGWTVLMYACAYAPEWVETLLQFNPDFKLVNEQKQTTLMISCMYNPSTMDIILKAGADKTIDYVDCKGFSALMKSAQIFRNKRNDLAFHTLLKYHPNLHLINFNGDDIFRLTENTDLTPFLKQEVERQELLKNTVQNSSSKIKVL